MTGRDTPGAGAPEGALVGVSAAHVRETGTSASDISGIVFESDREQEGRAVALERALRKARGDAMAIARAAGGRLGRLLEVSTQPQMRPMMAQAMEMRASNAVLPPQDVVVNVFVQARWEFVGGTE